MDSDLLALHWVEHSRVFSQAIGNLRTKTSYTDATLACEGNFYPVHKFVLSTCSQYFNAIFECTPCINPVVVINNITCKELEALLDFMYFGDVSVKESLIPDVVRAAECLKIRGLSIIDDESVKTNLKDKARTHSSGPARKRKRTAATKKKVSDITRIRIPSTSPHKPSESYRHVAAYSPDPPSDHNDENEENLDYDEDHAPDHISTEQSQESLSENYDTNHPHTSPEDNAPSNYLESGMSSTSQPNFAVQSSQSMHSSDTIVNHHNPVSPPHLPATLHSSALEVSSNEQTPGVSMHIAVDEIKSEKIECEKPKPHLPASHETVGSEEIPHLLDSWVDLGHRYDAKGDPGSEVATFHAVEPNKPLYEFPEALPSAVATSSHQEVCPPKDPVACSSSKKTEQNPQNPQNPQTPTEEDPALKCSFCGKQCMKRDSYRRHIRTHHKEPYCCKECPFTTTVYKVYLQHKKDEHVCVHKCSSCEFSTDRHGSFKRHVASHEKPHKCPECKFCTNRLQNLQKHIKNKHEKQEKK